MCYNVRVHYRLKKYTLMSSLTRFDKDGLELIVDTSTGEVFASQSAMSRMVGVSETSIRKWITSNQIAVKKLETPTTTGVKTSNLLSEEAIYQALEKYNPSLLIQCAKVGLRIYLHGLAGYKYQVKPQVPQTFAEALQLAADQAKEIELQNQQIKLLEEDNQRQAEAIDELFEYSSIIRIAKFNNCSEKAFSWHKLKAASIAMNLEIKRVPCPRFTTKNLYHHNAWRFVYPNYKLPETTTLIIKSE